MIEEKVILVNDRDEPIGSMGKLEAHQKGLLHRAFSVFVLNPKGELLLQRRAFEKYHSPGLWTNTCCSHQREKEDNITAGRRRLKEEMGFEVPLEDIFSFVYKATFDNGLIEHEYDHVLLGFFDGVPNINPEEVSEWKWISLTELHEDLCSNPDQYTVWFQIIFDRFYRHINSVSA